MWTQCKADCCRCLLCAQVADFGKKQTGLDQYAIARYAEALEVVPRTIAENSGLPATEVMARLYAAHSAGQVSFRGVLVLDSSAFCLQHSSRTCGLTWVSWVVFCVSTQASFAAAAAAKHVTLVWTISLCCCAAVGQHWCGH
jgi:hypothetical protein